MPKATPIIDDYVAIAAAMREQARPADSAADSPDAGLLKLCQEFHGWHVAANAPDITEDESAERCDQRSEVANAIDAIDVTTLAGPGPRPASP